jgi:anti-anti-sigma factor
VFGEDNYKQFATVREVEPRRVMLHVFGDVDISSAVELIEAIDEAANFESDSLLISNLSKCRYFDSSGLAALIHARKLLGSRITVLVKARSPVLRVMQIVGFDCLFNVVRVAIGRRHGGGLSALSLKRTGLNAKCVGGFCPRLKVSQGRLFDSTGESGL